MVSEFLAKIAYRKRNDIASSKLINPYWAPTTWWQMSPSFLVHQVKYLMLSSVYNSEQEQESYLACASVIKHMCI